MTDDTADKRKMSILVMCLIGSIVVFGVIVYINQHTGFLSKSDLAYYQYSNGEDNFNVRKVMKENYVGWQIEMYVKDFRYILELYNDPAHLEDIPVDRGVRNILLDDKTIFVTWEPDQNRSIKTAFAYGEINKVVDEPDLFNIRVNVSQASPFKEYPVKTCKDASRYSSVIWLKLGGETGISAEGSCVILQGADEDEIIRAADRLVLLLLGVMK